MKLSALLQLATLLAAAFLLLVGQGLQPQAGYAQETWVSAVEAANYANYIASEAASSVSEAASSVLGIQADGEDPNAAALAGFRASQKRLQASGISGAQRGEKLDLDASRHSLNAGRLRVLVDGPTGSLEITTLSGRRVAATGAASPYVRSGGDVRRLVRKSVSTSAGCDALGCYTAVTLEWNFWGAPHGSVVTAVRISEATTATSNGICGGSGLT